MRWLTHISGRQRLWLVTTLVVVLAVVAFGMDRQKVAGAALARSFIADMAADRGALRLPPPCGAVAAI